MRQEFLDMMRDSKATHEAHYLQLKKLQDAGTTDDVKELADSAFALKQAEEWFDDLRKQFRKEREHYEQMCGAVWSKTSLTTAIETGDDSIKTEYVTATVKIEKNASLPRKKQEPEQFEQLMNYLGIPKHLWNSDDPEASEVVSIHWPGFTALLSKYLAEGKPMPPGIDPKKVFTRFILSMRRKPRKENSNE